MPTKHKRSSSVKKGKHMRRKSHRKHSSKKMMGGAGCGAAKQTGGSPASYEVMNFVNTSGPGITDYLQMELPSRDSISNLKTQVQMGGSSAKNQQAGGSMVSDTVMSAKTGMNDFMGQLPGQNGGAGSCGGNNKKMLGGGVFRTGSKKTPTITEKMFGGAGSCGGNNKKMDGGAGCNAKQAGGYSSAGAAKQAGGSPASARLNGFTEQYNTSTLKEKKQDVITPDMISGGAEPKLYELTGGSWGSKSGKGKKGKGKGKGKKSMSVKKVMNPMAMQTGGSFWNLAGCGPWNGTDAGRKYADYFSKTSKCPGPEWYANPPELPKAGSGDAADLITGATYPFA